MKINLGRGSNKIDGFINVDKYSENADLVYFSHVIEHFNKADVNLVLNEINRILKRGGKLIIETPDMECLVKKYRRACFAKPIIDKIFYFLRDKGLFDKYPLKYIRSAFNIFLLEDEIFIDAFFGGVKPGMEHYYLYNFRLLKNGFMEIKKTKSPEYFHHIKSKCNFVVSCIKR